MSQDYPATILCSHGRHDECQNHSNRCWCPCHTTSPDCRDSNHHKCDKNAWDDKRDEPAYCGCKCHRIANAREAAHQAVKAFDVSPNKDTADQAIIALISYRAELQ